MKTDLDELIQWFQANKLSLNLLKTNYMLFRNKPADSSEENSYEVLQFGNEIISHASEVKFLGFKIDEGLNWSNHCKTVLTKLSKSSYILNTVKNILPIYCMKSLYYSFVYSHLSYGIHVWGPSLSKANQNQLIKSPKKIIRIVHNSKYNAHTNELFRDSDILKFLDIIDLELCKFMFLSKQNQLPLPLNNLFKLNNEVHQYSTRNKNDPRVAVHRSARYNNSFLARGPSSWSTLPYDIKNSSQQVKGFSKTLKKLKIDEYKLNM